MRDTFSRRTKVCILDEHAASEVRAGIAYRCNRRGHPHYSRAQVESLVRTGEIVWIGKHRKLASFVRSRTWRKVFSRFHARCDPHTGEVIDVSPILFDVKGHASVQLVRGGASY